MSLRKAINAKCRECIFDPLDVGTARQQIACCVQSDCPLHSVRPVNTKTIPQRLLASWGVSAAQLCERAQLLVQTELIPKMSHNGPIASKAGESEHGGAV